MWLSCSLSLISRVRRPSLLVEFYAGLQRQFPGRFKQRGIGGPGNITPCALPQFFVCLGRFGRSFCLRGVLMPGYVGVSVTAGLPGVRRRSVEGSSQRPADGTHRRRQCLTVIKASETKLPSILSLPLKAHSATDSRRASLRVKERCGRKTVKRLCMTSLHISFSLSLE